MSLIHRLMLAGSLALLLAAGVAAQTPPAPSSPAVPTDEQVTQLQQQVDALRKQVDRLAAAPDPASRQQLMQQHWQSMQTYMAQMMTNGGWAIRGCPDAHGWWLGPE